MTNRADRIFKIKKDLETKYFPKGCYVCHKKLFRGSRMAFHHIEYFPSDRSLNSFSNSEQYIQHVAEAIKENPARFMLLCNGHHMIITWGSQMDKTKLTRLIKAIRITRKAQNRRRSA